MIEAAGSPGITFVHRFVSRRHALASGLALLSALIVSTSPVLGQQAFVLYDSTSATGESARAALTEELESAGYSVTTEDIVIGRDPGDLGAYSCVWDLRATVPLSGMEQIRFDDYAAAGGSLYLGGEHGGFDFRNSSINVFLDGLGAGGVVTDPIGPLAPVRHDFFEQANPDHFLNGGCEPVREIVYDGVGNGAFLSTGTGTWISAEENSMSIGAAAWSEGDLVAAPESRILYVLDTNYISTAQWGTLDWRLSAPLVPTENRYFLRNAIRFLCDRVPLDLEEECVCEPRNHGYWHRYCLGTNTIDPGRYGTGDGPGPSKDSIVFDPGLVDEVDPFLARFGIQACAALDDGSFSDPRLAALRELSVLYLNLKAGYLQRGCPIELNPKVEGEELLVVDGIELLIQAIEDGGSTERRDGRWIGGHIANREALRR